MTRLDSSYNWGSTLSEENPDLYRQLNDVYTSIAEKSNGKTNKTRSSGVPSSDSDANKSFDIGDIWVDKIGPNAHIMVDRTTPEQVTWKQIT